MPSNFNRKATGVGASAPTSTTARTAAFAPEKLSSAGGPSFAPSAKGGSPLRPSSPATVYLVGAGPGDPELLTVKAVRLLAIADLVLHDNLVAQPVLDLINPRAEKIDVGKRAGTKWLSQDDINALLVAAGKNPNHKIVVRLKGGDPSLFGRAAEEIESLRAAGIPFEVVPGISAAFASAAAAKVSLTDRRLASHVLFTTFSRKPEAQLLPSIGLTPETTVAVYMPGPDYTEVSRWLIDSGFAAETPCVVVSKASQPDQREHRATLATLRANTTLPAPSLLIVGRVASQHEVVSSAVNWLENSSDSAIPHANSDAPRPQ